MKACLVIIPSNTDNIYIKNAVSMDVCLYEAGNYASKHNIDETIESLVQNGYLVIITNGIYHKIYINGKCTTLQIDELERFLSSNNSIHFTFAKITIMHFNVDKKLEKIYDGNMSIVDIEKIIRDNITIQDGDTYRVPSNINYSDDESKKYNK